MQDASAAQTPGEDENPDAGIEDNLAGRIRMVLMIPLYAKGNKC
jgi:hypothetical protein